MRRKFDSREINSRHYYAGKGRLARYLGLNSCRQLVGSYRPESKIRNCRIVLMIIASIIFVIGLVFVII